MTITEADRLEMHHALRKALGDKMGDVVMEHLPPVGWGDVARSADIDHLAALMDARFAAVDIRFTSLESRTRGIVAGLWAMGGLTATGFIGLFTLIATKV